MFVSIEGELPVLEVDSHLDGFSVFELLEGEVDYLAIDQRSVALETQLDDALLFPDILLTLFGLAKQADPDKSFGYLIDPHLNINTVLFADRVAAGQHIDLLILDLSGYSGAVYRVVLEVEAPWIHLELVRFDDPSCHWCRHPCYPLSHQLYSGDLMGLGLGLRLGFAAVGLFLLERFFQSSDPVFKFLDLLVEVIRCGFDEFVLEGRNEIAHILGQLISLLLKFVKPICHFPTALNLHPRHFNADVLLLLQDHRLQNKSIPDHCSILLYLPLSKTKEVADIIKDIDEGTGQCAILQHSLQHMIITLMLQFNGNLLLIQAEASPVLSNNLLQLHTHLYYAKQAAISIDILNIKCAHPKQAIKFIWTTNLG